MFSLKRKQINANAIQNQPLWLMTLLTLTTTMGPKLFTAAQYPCSFMDTVNITGSFPHESHLSATPKELSSNQSYIYKWMVVPPDLVGIYDFVIINGQRVPSPKHLRACVCKLKPCIRFCCNPGFYYSLQNSSCMPLPTNDTASMDPSTMTVRFNNGSTLSVNVSAHFLVNIGAPCETMRVVLKENRQMDWLLYENGSIINKQYAFSRQYCYSPLSWRKDKEKEEESPNWHWEPLTCVPDRLPFNLGVREWTYAICKF